MTTIRQPSPELARTIDLCWAKTGDDVATFFEVYPSSSVDLIFRFSESGNRVVVLGPRTETVNVEVAARARYFGVSFRCGQTPRLFDTQHTALVDARLEPNRLLRHSTEQLATCLSALPNTEKRQRHIENLIRDKPPLIEHDQCRSICAYIQATGGLVQVAETAAHFNIHVRSLERIFRKHLGLPPKFVIRSIRLRKLVDAIRAGGQTDLIGLAFELGYADQSHMIRDFKKLTGRVPVRLDPVDTGRLAGGPTARTVHRYKP